MLRRRHARLPLSRRGKFALVVFCAVFWGGMLNAAFGTWGSTVSASMSVSSATLSAPTSPAAVNQNCVVATSRQVKVTWTATSSAFADGYDVLRGVVSGGPYLSQGTVSGQATTSFTDTGVLPSTTYYYVVQATKNSWRSVNSSQVSVTTPTALCT
jgi:hypothetical protein